MATTEKQQKMCIVTLEDLPNEVILKILGNLGMEDLFAFAKLSRRFKCVSQDESLWIKMNISLRKLPMSYLLRVLDNGCKYLSLYHSRIRAETGTSDDFILKKPCQLRYLDFSFCKAKYDFVLERILVSCNSLQKLSLARIRFISLDMIHGICTKNSSTITTLDLCSARFTESHIGPYRNYFQTIIKNCNKLTELNLSYTDLSREDIIFLVTNLTETIENLNLASIKGIITDQHIEKLVKRCNNLKQLNLHDNCELTNITLTNIIDYLKHSLEKLDMTYTIKNINIEELYNLRSLEKLRVFNMYDLHHIHGRLSAQFVDLLKKKLPNVDINEKDLNIAIVEQSFDPEDGFWDIQAKRQKASCILQGYNTEETN